MSLLDFLHGVEVVSISGGTRAVQTVSSSVIGLVGTASDADAEAFPLDTPVAVYSRGGYAGLGASGTLADALNAIFDQTSGVAVVVRVAEGNTAAATMANIVGGVDATSGARKGIAALRDAKSITGVTPMLLIAPGFTSTRPIALTAVTVTAQGTGYTSAPTVAFTGGGSDPDKILPTGHAVLGTGANAGKVVSVVIDTHGSNLTAAPAVVFSGGAGTGATATSAIDHYVNPVADALRIVGNSLRAHAIVSGPNTTDADAIAYRNDFGDRRVFIVDPGVKVLQSDGTYADQDNAAYVAGVTARTDATQGFWKSPSNEEIFGIGGTSRPIDFSLGDPSTRANLLNSNQIATIIRDDGFRLWGNRTCATDPNFAFLCVSRTADMIELSIQAAHLWACDQVLGKAYVDSVTSSVNAYLRSLQARGAILGGKCWFDPDLNTPTDLAAGHVTFSFDFTAPAPAERVTFQSSITDAYVTSIFSAS